MLFKVLKTIVRGDGGDEAEEVGLELAALPTEPADIASVFPFGSTVSVVPVGDDLATNQKAGLDAAAEAGEYLAAVAQAKELLKAPESVRALVKRILDGEVIELDGDTTISSRGVTIGPHIGIPLDYAKALSATVRLEYGDFNQKRIASIAMAEVADFVQTEAAKTNEEES